MSHDLLRSWVADLNARHGLSLTLGDHGLCGFADAAGTRFTLEVHGGERVSLIAELLPAPREAAERLDRFEALLHLNLDTDVIGAARLAVDGKDDMVVLLIDQALAALDSQTFEQMITAGVQAAAACRERLTAEPQPAEPFGTLLDRA